MTRQDKTRQDKTRQEVNCINLYLSNGKETSYQNRIYNINYVMTALTAGFRNLILEEVEKMEKEIKVIEFNDMVKVRKNPINETALKNCLREHKTKTNKEIAEALKLPLTKIEHWFRNDNGFSIPEAAKWQELKELLNIKTNEFDKAILEFEEKPNVYEKAQRLYLTDGIAPTITATEKGVKIMNKEKNINMLGLLDIKGDEQIRRGYRPDGLAPTLNTMQGGNREPKIMIKQATAKGYAELEVPGVADLSFPSSSASRGRVQDGGKVCPTIDTCATGLSVFETKYRIRKLTPRECWRLMGFDDLDFTKAQAVNSNTQLYKQAGNSIVVNVLEAIFKNLIEQ